MPISEAHVGREYPPSPPYEVTAGKIAEFAAALGATGGDPQVAPPTFAAVITNGAWDLLFNDPELGLSLSRIIHGDQRFRFVRDLRAGDVCRATLRIDKVRVRAGSEIISPTVTVTDATGEVVLEAAATFFHAREAVA